MQGAIAAWRRWQAAAGPWRGYVVCPTLQVGKAPASPAVSLPRIALNDLFARDGTAVLADLDPIYGVALAAEASRSGVAYAVLVLQRWPHPRAVLPTEGLLAALVGASSVLTNGVHTPNVVFVLDGERRRSIAARPAADPRVDNRYDVAATDLPDFATLRRAGIQRVVRLTRAA